MTEPFYTSPARRTRLFVPWNQQTEYVGHADLEGYQELMSDIRHRIPRVQWEDIDPDNNPTTPRKPSWRCTSNDDLDNELALLERYLCRSEGIITPAERRARAIAMQRWREDQAELEAEMVRREAEREAAEMARQAEISMRSTLVRLEDNYDLLLEYEQRGHLVNSHFIIHGNVEVKMSDGHWRSIRPPHAMWVIEHGRYDLAEPLRKGCPRSGCARPSHFVRKTW